MKKLLAIALTLVLAAGLLTACGDKTPTPTPTQAVTVTPTAAADDPSKKSEGVMT